MAKDIITGNESFAISIWNPLLLKRVDEIYSELKENFGDKISMVQPAIYGDFGEAHYPAGWNNWLHPKPTPEEARPGFWAGDELAFADYKAKMLKKYNDDLETLNAAWHTEYKNIDDIKFPLLDGTDNRRMTVDFVNWYYDAMTFFTLDVCKTAKKYYPDVHMAPALGCGDENPLLGQDNSAIAREMAKIGCNIHSTHGSSPNFIVKRLSTPCKHYGIKIATETASGTNRNDGAKKFFIDASNGVSHMFEYPNAIITVADIFSQTRRHLREEFAINKSALFFPTSWHRNNLNKG